VVVVRRGGFAPPQQRTPRNLRFRWGTPANGHGVTARWARWCPSRRACHHAGDVGLPCLFGFQCAVPDSPGKKKKGPGVARPLVDSLFNRGRSNSAHGGDSGPGGARLGCERTTNAVASYIGLGMRAQPAFQLLFPNPSFCL